jgi:hypothetical protein
MNIITKCMQNSQRMIQALEKQQDRQYKRCLTALKIKPNDEPAATILFDYLFNKSWTAAETLKRIKRSDRI